MQIGSLAKLAGVNVQTLRFYERERLLPEPERTRSGYRRYAESDLDHVRFIKDWQEMGFSLREIRQLIHLHRLVAALPRRIRGRSGELGKIAVIARERLKGIDEKLRLLRAMKKQLSQMLGQIEGTESLVCPALRRNRSLRLLRRFRPFGIPKISPLTLYLGTDSRLPESSSSRVACIPTDSRASSGKAACPGPRQSW